MLTLAQYQALSPVEQFKANLSNCMDMEGRRFSVRVLTEKIGKDEAHKIARENGLSNSYYFN